MSSMTKRLLVQLVKNGLSALMEERRTKNTVTLDNLFDTMKEGEMKKSMLLLKPTSKVPLKHWLTVSRRLKLKVSVLTSSIPPLVQSTKVMLPWLKQVTRSHHRVQRSANATNKSQADQDGVDIRLHRVIYNAIDEIEHAMKGKLEPTYKEEVIGEIEVRDIFKASKVGTIAGGMVTDVVIFQVTAMFA